MNSKASNAAIGVFDSGVGGLTILRAVQKQLPSERLVYVADAGHAPYGERDAEYIAKRCLAVAGYLHKLPVKALVVACNTASVTAIKVLRETFEIPIIGIEPAIKPAVSITRTAVVGVLATSRTVQSLALKRLCELYGLNVEIILQPCPSLVDRIERGELNTPETIQLLRGYMAPMLDAGADTIVLGCTHYPFVREVIQDIAGDTVTMIEPGAAVAKQLCRRLDELRLCNTQAHLSEGERVAFYTTTGQTADAAAIISSLWGRAVAVQYLENI